MPFCFYRFLCIFNQPPAEPFWGRQVDLFLDPEPDTSRYRKKPGRGEHIPKPLETCSTAVASAGKIQPEEGGCLGVNHHGNKWKWRRRSTKQFDPSSARRVSDDFCILACEPLLWDGSRSHTWKPLETPGNTRGNSWLL